MSRGSPSPEAGALVAAAPCPRNKQPHMPPHGGTPSLLSFTSLTEEKGRFWRFCQDHQGTCAHTLGPSNQPHFYEFSQLCTWTHVQ